jgi:hypothetical protein
VTRPHQQREVENASYHDRRVGAGIADMIVMGPAEHIPELPPILLNWRHDATLLLESDLPSADQILEIHGVWTLRTKLPIDAFETPATAEAWPPAQNPRLDARRLHASKRHSQP